MAADMLYGSLGFFLAYRVGIVSGAYQIQNAAGSAAATSTADAAIKIDGFSEQTNLQPGDNGMVVTVDNYDVSEEAIGFFNKFARKVGSSAGTAPAGIVMENSVTRGGSETAELPLLLYQSYGPLNSAGTKVLMHWGLSRCALNSGQIIYKAGQWIKPTITLNGINAQYALSIPEDLWDGTHLGDISSQTLHQFYPYEREYLAKGPRT